MLRTTTVSNFGLLAPQYFVLRFRVTCEVVLYAERTYGPLPAPTDAEELSHDSALSFWSAPTEALPPCCFRSFELTMPVDGLARIAGNCPAGVLERMMTRYLPDGLMTTPSSRNAGLPFRLIRRLSEKTTSADVSLSPFAKCTFGFRLKVNVFAPFDAFHEDTSSGTG